MVRLYKKTRRILFPLIVIIFILLKYIVTVRDGRKGFLEVHYSGVFKSLLKQNKNQIDGSIKRDQPSDGYKIAKRLAERCLADDNSSYTMRSVRLNMMYQTTSGDLQLCPVWKAGSTFLKRLFLINNKEEYRNITNPFDISFLVTHIPMNGFMSNLPPTKRYVFVRDPYKRLLSSFIDKLYAPNPVYWRIIGTRAIRLLRPGADEKSLSCGHDLTFTEYVKYVIVALGRSHTFKATPDIHFQQMSKLCKPCTAKYDFIGKLETFRSDSFELLDRLNMTATKELIRDTMDELSADDAILDTISQPFDEVFLNGFIGCISFTEALIRAWTKLKMRGLIGQRKLYLSENITKGDIIDQARKARWLSTADERRRLKKEFLSKFYSTITSDDLEKLRLSYADDFRLFEYNDKPGYIYSVRRKVLN